jgi:hypothetical protein
VCDWGMTARRRMAVGIAYELETLRNCFKKIINFFFSKTFPRNADQYV